MAVVWPSKNNFANGDVLTATNMNNIGDTLNVFNPTSATNGQVWQANGSGSGSYATLSVASMTSLASGNLPTGSGTLTLSSISQSYTHLLLILADVQVGTGNTYPYALLNNDSGATRYATASFRTYGSTSSVGGEATSQLNLGMVGIAASTNWSALLYVPFYSLAMKHLCQGMIGYTQHSTLADVVFQGATWHDNDVAIDRIDFIYGLGNYSAGTYNLYGIK